MTTLTPPTATPKHRRNLFGILRDDASIEVLACRSCGVGVERPDPSRIEVLEVWPRVIAMSARDLPASSVDVRVTRCAECTGRRARAAALVAVHRLGLGQGDCEVEIDRVDAALAGLDLLGIRGDRTASLTRTPADVLALIDAFAPVGGAASWSFTLGQGGSSSPVSRRWAHVPAELNTTAAQQYKNLIHRRSELPTDCPPPASEGAARGCLLCGLGTLHVIPSDAAAAWGPLERVQPGELGGESRPELVSGYVCPACRADVAKFGAPSLPSIDAALLRFLGYTLSSSGRLTRSLAPAWCALPVGTEPNSKPWGHVDTAKLTSLLDTAHYITREAAQ